MRRDPRHADILRYMWPDHTSREIGDVLGVTVHCIEARVRRMGLPKKRHPLTWNQSDIDTAIRMRNEGHSSREIGACLGKTRNSILGKFFRLGLPRNSHSTTYRRPYTHKQKPPKPINFSSKVTKLKPRRLPSVAPPINDPVHILQRTGSQCAYIVGHHLCCGAETYRLIDKLGHPRITSWCPYHFNLVFRGKDVA